MKRTEFDQIVHETLEMCDKVLVVKAKEYATEDRLHNFKIAAGMQGISPIQALAGMMAKHTVSVYDMCYANREFPIELWNEKITDHMNYLILLKGLVIEQKTSGKMQGHTTQELLDKLNKNNEHPFKSPVVAPEG